MANVRTSRRSGFITRNGVQRRETLWVGIPRAADTLAASATAALSQSFNAAVLALRPFTIVRTRMQWLTHSDQSAASESFVGNIGLAVVSDQAVAVGVTAIPTPATDLDSDLWFVSEQWPSRFTLVGSDVTENITPRTIDSKAMRKVEGGQDLIIAVEAGIGGSGVVVIHTGRMLIKLH